MWPQVQSLVLKGEKEEPTVDSIHLVNQCADIKLCLQTKCNNSIILKKIFTCRAAQRQLDIKGDSWNKNDIKKSSILKNMNVCFIGALKLQEFIFIFCFLIFYKGYLMSMHYCKMQNS